MPANLTPPYLAAELRFKFVHAFKFAKMWSAGQSKHTVKIAGQMAERTHQLEDGDILELHG